MRKSTRGVTGHVLSAATIALLAGLASPALAQPAQLVSSSSSHTSTTHPTAQVPGATGVYVTNTSDIVRQPTGDRWYTVVTNAGQGFAGTNDQIVLGGDGLALFAGMREGGTTIPVGRIPPIVYLTAVPRFDDAGRWALTYNEAGGVGVVTVFNGTDINVVAQNNDPVPGLPGAFFNAINTTNGTFNMTSRGPTFQATVLDGANPSVTEVGMGYLATGGLTPLIATGVDQPSGQTGGSFTLRDIDGTGFMTDSTGTNYIARGLLNNDNNTANDAVVVVNDAVVAQEGFTPAFLSAIGSTATYTSTTQIGMESNGVWFLRGSFSDGAKIIRNGRVIAAVGQPIAPGSGENWASFRDVQGDHAGNYIVIGSSNTTADRAEVVVLNGKFVIAREGTQVDVNADSTITAADLVDADGDTVGERPLYLHQYDDRNTLANDGWAYIATRLRTDPADTANVSQLTTASSVVRANACAADVAGPAQSTTRDRDLTADDIIVYIGWFFAGDLRADFAGAGQTLGGDGELTADDIIVYIGSFFAGC